MEQINYRHEYKYPLTRGQILIEDARISGIMSKDIHAGDAGFYNIRSLYFDDYENSCYMDNENGVITEKNTGFVFTITIRKGFIWN